MFKPSKKLSVTILASLLLLSLESWADQIVEGADKKTVEVTVSAREQNRLAVEGRKLDSVVPSQKGVISTTKDESNGVLYFALTNEIGTVSLFVTDDQGATYRLLLVPRPVAAEAITIRPPNGAASAAKRERTEGARTLSYQRRIKDLVLIMTDDELAERVDSVAVNQEVPLWKEGRLVLARKYMDGDYVGEKYILTNISPSDMLLVEPELFRRGVNMVSIEHHTLAPGETTNIFIVRGRKDNE